MLEPVSYRSHSGSLKFSYCTHLYAPSLSTLSRNDSLFIFLKLFDMFVSLWLLHAFTEGDMVTERPSVVESYFFRTRPVSAYKMSTTAPTRFGQCLSRHRESPDVTRPMAAGCGWLRTKVLSCHPLQTVQTTVVQSIPILRLWQQWIIVNWGYCKLLSNLTELCQVIFVDGLFVSAMWWLPTQDLNVRKRSFENEVKVFSICREFANHIHQFSQETFPVEMGAWSNLMDSTGFQGQCLRRLAHLGNGSWCAPEKETCEADIIIFFKSCLPFSQCVTVSSASIWVHV